MASAYARPRQTPNAEELDAFLRAVRDHLLTGPEGIHSLRGSISAILDRGPGMSIRLYITSATPLIERWTREALGDGAPAPPAPRAAEGGSSFPPAAAR